jgi:multiple sugar transport system ATP-binding protein
MDEPFSDLDELLKRNLRAEVLRLQRRLNITMIHVTHDQEEAMTLGDILVVMNDGQIAQLGDPDTVFNQPNSVFVATFIGSPQINRFDCTLERADEEAVLLDSDLQFTLTGEVASCLGDATGEEIALCVRPQHLSWSENEPEDGLSMPITVEVIEKIGTEDIIRCSTPGGSEVVAVVASGTLNEGAEGYLRADQADIHLFDGYDEDAERLN